MKEERPNDPTKKIYILTEITVGLIDTIQATRKHQTHARGQIL